MDGKVICYNRYYDLTKAYLAKSILDEHEIFSFIENEHITTANPFLTNAVGGIRLMINEQDKEKVAEILKLDIEEEENTTDVIEEKQIATEKETLCPKCNSTNNRKEDVSAPAFVISILTLGFPIPFLKRKYHCFDCGHEWK